MKNYQGEEWRTLTAEGIVEVVESFLKGGKIEARSYAAFMAFRDLKKQWTEVEFPSWDFSQYQYRVKPK